MRPEYEKLLQKARIEEDVCREEKLPKFETIKVSYLEYKFFEVFTRTKRKLWQGNIFK